MLILLAQGSSGHAAPWLTADPAAVDSTLAAEANCLAQAVFYEAGGEVRLGQEAVAEVVLNRLHSPAYPKTVCGVVFQGAQRATGCQFTFTCDGSRARRRPEGEAWRQAEAVAADAMAGRLVSPVGVSTHYHAVWMRPAWSVAMTPTLRIGGHQFYVSGGRAFGRVGAAPSPAPVAPQAAAFSVWGLQVAVVAPGSGGAATVSVR